jgi:hypothetical protein
MDFSDALKALKEGKKVARKGWNGYRRGMYIYLTDGREIFEHEWDERDPAHTTTLTERLNGKVHIMPHIDMVGAHGERIIGWLASQTDLLGDDWVIIE